MADELQKRVSLDFIAACAVFALTFVLLDRLGNSGIGNAMASMTGQKNSGQPDYFYRKLGSLSNCGGCSVFNHSTSYNENEWAKTYRVFLSRSFKT